MKDQKPHSAVLETKRLILKKPELSDLDNLTALRTDPDVMKYIGTGTIQTKEQVQEFITNAAPYYEKHGLAFYSVFEKATSEFVGQAGLLHLSFNVNQPEIELAYRLHKKYWTKGYASELAKALIDWGFKHLSVDRLVAVVHPENEKSRRVLEKSGMHYVGKINYQNNELPKYEIDKNNIDYDKIKLVPASLKEYPTIQNMGRFYVYDMSKDMGSEEGWELPKNGLHECIDFKKYWEVENAFPFLVRYGDELAGFVIIDKKGSDSTIDFNMAQFFILRKFQTKGIGRYVTMQCFDKFHGAWEVMVMPGNEGAYRFWRSVIRDYTNHNFIEYTRDVTHLNNSRKNIFRFNSKLD